VELTEFAGKNFKLKLGQRKYWQQKIKPHNINAEKFTGKLILQD
jgi:hypothetical protein